MSVALRSCDRSLEQSRGFNDVGGIQFDADIPATEPVRHQPDRARTEKGIEDKFTRCGRCEDARLDQRLGEGGDVRAARIGGVDVPHGSAVAGPSVLGRLLHRLVIVTVVLRLGEHEEVFVGAGRTIFHTLRHDIRLVPYDVAAQKPSIFLKGQSQPPRDADQILVLESGRIVGPHVHGAIRILFVRCAPAAIATSIAVADVQPQDAVALEDALHLGKNIGEILDKFSQRRFQTNLPSNAIIAQSPVWW